jgi:hypothetical protein
MNKPDLTELEQLAQLLEGTETLETGPETAPQPQLEAEKAIFRRKDGRFTSGNPYQIALGGGGRPVGAEDRVNKLSVAYGVELQNQVEGQELTNAEAIAKRLIDVAITGKPTQSILAAKELGDRSEGKPMQAIAVAQMMDRRTADELARVAVMLLIIFQQ